MQPLDPTPLLQPHYRPSSLIRVGPPQCPASVRSPHGFCRLCFSLHIRTTGSRSSTREPGSDSRLLYTGRRLPSCQVSDRLIPEGNEAPGFDEQFCALRCFNGGSLAFVSPDPYLLGVRPRRFDSNAHYRRLLTAAAWSGLKPAPGSRLRRAFLHLPCSLCTVGQFILNLPFRAPAAHSLPDTFFLLIDQPIRSFFRPCERPSELYGRLFGTFLPGPHSVRDISPLL